jgi:hypothetical protein
MSSACIIPRRYGSVAPRAKGYYLGRSLTRAAAAARFRLGRALCGFDDPFHPLREPTPGPTIPCASAVESGGVGGGSYVIELGTDIGTVTLNYEAYSIPDGFTVNWNGVDVIATGVVSGSGSPTFVKTSAYPTTATVTVEAPDEGTAWEFMLSCPA